MWGLLVEDEGATNSTANTHEARPAALSDLSAVPLAAHADSVPCSRWKMQSRSDARCAQVESTVEATAMSVKKSRGANVVKSIGPLADWERAAVELYRAIRGTTATATAAPGEGEEEEKAATTDALPDEALLFSAFSLSEGATTFSLPCQLERQVRSQIAQDEPTKASARPLLLQFLLQTNLLPVASVGLSATTTAEWFIRHKSCFLQKKDQDIPHCGSTPTLYGAPLLHDIATLLVRTGCLNLESAVVWLLTLSEALVQGLCPAEGSEANTANTQWKVAAGVVATVFSLQQPQQQHASLSSRECWEIFSAYFYEAALTAAFDALLSHGADGVSVLKAEGTEINAQEGSIHNLNEVITEAKAGSPEYARKGANDTACATRPVEGRAALYSTSDALLRLCFLAKQNTAFALPSVITSSTSATQAEFVLSSRSMEEARYLLQRRWAGLACRAVQCTELLREQAVHLHRAILIDFLIS